MVEASLAVTKPARRNVPLLHKMKVALLLQMHFAGLVFSATSPSSNINPSNPCSPLDVSYGITIWTQADADAVSNCSSISSDFYIDFTFPGNLHLDGLQSVNGSLGVGKFSPNRSYYDGSNVSINNAGISMLNEVSFSNLTTVNGYLAFESIPTLLNISLPYIHNITLSFILEDLPSLATFDCGSSLMSVGSYVLVNGTDLQTLAIGGIGDFFTGTYFADYLYIVNNTSLEQLQLFAYNISGTLHIEGSYDISLPYMEKISGNLTIINAKSISVDLLSSVGQDIQIFSTDSLINFSAPLLTDFRGDLLALDNAALNNISMPTLHQMQGGIQIRNNSALQTICGFPQLREIGESVDIEGPFDAVCFPQLGSFYGTNFTISSSHSDLNCTDLDAYAHSNPAIIRSVYTCKDASSSTTGTPGDGAGSGTQSGDSTNSGELSTGAKAGIGVGVVLAVALTVALVLNLYLLRRRDKALGGAQVIPPEYIPELPQGENHWRPGHLTNGAPVEAEAEVAAKEISCDMDPRELEYRPIDDSRHNHHRDIYEGPPSAEHAGVSPLTDGSERPTPIEETRNSRRADLHEMPS